MIEYANCTSHAFIYVIARPVGFSYIILHLQVLECASTLDIVQALWFICNFHLLSLYVLLFLVVNYVAYSFAYYVALNMLYLNNQGKQWILLCCYLVCYDYSFS